MQQADVAHRLRHLLVAHLHHAVVHPGARQRLTARRLGLRDLVLVVREDEVRPASVHLERDAEHGLGHRGALDVPAGPAVTPGRLPVGVLVLLARLPEREVLRRLLQLGGIVALALLHLLQRAVRQLAVAGKGRHPEVHVAAALVRVIRLHERLDQGDDLADRLRGLRLLVGAAEAEQVGVRHVGGGHLGRELRARHAPLAGGVVDLVVHVGDVDHQRGVVSLVLEKALQQGEDEVRARVADVDPPIDGRAAGVDADAAGLARLDGNDPAAQRVLDAQLAHGREVIQATGGRCSVQRSSPSSCAASARSMASSPWRPTSCMPIGRPSSLRPTGTEIDG